MSDRVNIERPKAFYEYMRLRMLEGRDLVEAMCDALLFGPAPVPADNRPEAR